MPIYLTPRSWITPCLDVAFDFGTAPILTSLWGPLSLPGPTEVRPPLQGHLPKVHNACPAKPGPLNPCQGPIVTESTPPAPPSLIYLQTYDLLALPLTHSPTHSPTYQDHPLNNQPFFQSQLPLPITHTHPNLHTTPTSHTMDNIEQDAMKDMSGGGGGGGGEGGNQQGGGQSSGMDKTIDQGMPSSASSPTTTSHLSTSPSHPSLHTIPPLHITFPFPSLHFTFPSHPIPPHHLPSHIHHPSPPPPASEPTRR